jgi:hypothetical protein
MKKRNGITKIRADGFSGIAATSWDVDARMTSDRSDVGRGETAPRAS